MKSLQTHWRLLLLGAAAELVIVEATQTSFARHHLIGAISVLSILLPMILAISAAPIVGVLLALEGSILFVPILPPGADHWSLFPLAVTWSSATALVAYFSHNRKAIRTKLLLDNAQAEDRYSKLVEAALHSQANERARIADELHDDVLQVMVAVLLQLDVVKMYMNPVPSSFERAIVTLRHATERTRLLMFDLHDQMLADAGLFGALHEFCAGPDFVEFDTMIECPRERLDRILEELLFRTIREALFNVKKHSGATHVAILVAILHDRVEATIADDGIGFAPGGLPRSREAYHRGLSGMLDRVQIAGGHLDVISAPGEGCTISITVPLPE